MTYLDDLAAEIATRVPRELLPDADTSLLFGVYALLALTKGGNVSAADVHNAWAVWMRERDPEHMSLKPFEELDPATQASDEPFVQAIRTAAAALDSG